MVSFLLSPVTSAENVVFFAVRSHIFFTEGAASTGDSPRKIDRIKTTYIVTTVYSFILGLILGGLLVIFRREFIMLFTSNEEVIKYGEIRVMIMGASYCISAFMDNATASSRGCGKTIGPTVIIVMGTIVFRIIWIFTVFRYFHTLESLFLLYVSSWVLTAICANIYFCYSYKKIKKMHSYKPA